MNSHRTGYTSLLLACLLAACPSDQYAQEKALPAKDPERDSLEITVGITTNCPYTRPGCWIAAAPTLEQLPHVLKVDETFDAYNSTIKVWIEAGGGLPDLALWQTQFRQSKGESLLLRGIELTLEGEVSRSADGTLLFRWDRSPKDLLLLPLEHKLQWNFKKKHERGPEEEEKDAYNQLASRAATVNAKPLRITVTGRFQSRNGAPALEVREFFINEIP